jgi:glycosyltransferase involved in cell wall biosynthesis
MKLSVLMSVYGRDSAEFLRQSLDSLAAQTVPAGEIVLVEDGPLGAGLAETIRVAANLLPVVPVRLAANAGLGAALREGLSACRGEFVARMDADDICAPERFARQLEFLEQNAQIDVAGSAIAEFDDDPLAIRSIRRLPATHPELMRFAKYRNPLNHVTVMFRRRSVLDAGSYQPCAGFEDYHLWVRMLRGGFRLHNLSSALVYVRCGSGMQQRRGGFSYLLRELAFQRFLHSTGLLAASDCARNILLRAPIRMAPAFVRSFCYERFLREPAPPGGELNLE